MPSVWMCAWCKVTLLLSAKSHAVRSGEHMRPCYSEDTDSYTALLNFKTTCAVHIEDCEGWCLSGCRGSVAEHWRLKPEVSWVRLPATASLFTLLYFRLITSKFLYFQREAIRCSEQASINFTNGTVCKLHVN